MYLQLSPEQLQQLTDHALAQQPQEACGVIAGVGTQVREVIPLKNIAAYPEQAYRIEDRGLAAALFTMEKSGLSLLGFYHSHPQGEPIPSPVDIQQAAYPDVVYLIVGLRPAPKLAAWNIRHGRVVPVELIVGQGQAAPTADQPLTQSQRTAVLVGAVLAFIFVILLSVSLLPPAPELPLP